MLCRYGRNIFNSKSGIIIIIIISKSGYGNYLLTS